MQWRFLLPAAAIAVTTAACGSDSPSEPDLGGGGEPIMGTVWEMEAVHTSGWTAAAACPRLPTPRPRTLR